MKYRLKTLINALLAKFNLVLLNQERLANLLASESDSRLWWMLNEDGTEEYRKLASLKEDSKAQFLQDIFVARETGFKTGGFFVEFGATNGVDLSNTYLLEKRFDWRGILAEPAKVWHTQLEANRNCIIDNRCVWSESGQKMNFFEVKYSELSSISTYLESDQHNRKDGREYVVETVSLVDLLDQHQAPHRIDYLSLDTEGSELEILRAFDFAKYKVAVITVEHNYSPAREEIQGLLTRAGFVKKHERLSACDDWYVNQSIG